MATSTGGLFTANNLLMVNMAPSDLSGSRGTELTMKGQTAAGVAHTLARVEVAHRTAASDTNASVQFTVNNGSSQVAALTVDADAVVAGAPVEVPQVTVDGLTLQNAGGALVLAGAATPISVANPARGLVDTATEAVLETNRPVTYVTGAAESTALRTSLQLSCALSGTLSDDLSASRPVTALGNPGYARPGKGAAQCLLLRNPTQSTLAVANTAPVQLVDWTGAFTAPLTVAFWVNTEWTTRTMLLSLSAGTGVGVARALDVYIQSQILTAAWTLPVFATTTTSSTAPLQANQWYHVCVTLTAAHGAALYLNGTLQSSAAGTAAFTPATTLRLGAAADGYHPARARYSQVRVWNRTLSTAEVTSLYQGGAQRVFLVSNLHPTAAGREKRLVLQSGVGAARTAALSAATLATTAAAYSATARAALPSADLVWWAPLDGTLVETVGCRPPAATGAVQFSTGIIRSGRASLDLRQNTVGAAPATHVLYPVHAGLGAGPLTVAGWLYASNPSTGVATQVALTLGVDDVDLYRLQVTSIGQLQSQHRTGSTVGSTLPSNSTEIPLGTWTHVVATLEPGGEHRLYVNGALLESTAMASDSGGLASATGARPTGLRLGGPWVPTDTQAWQGLLQDVRLYSRALTATEVRSLADLPDLLPSGRGTLGSPATTDLAVHLPLGLTLEDSRGALLPPTVTGAELYSTSIVATGAGALDLRANVVGSAGSAAVLYRLPAPVAGATAVTVAAWVYPVAVTGGTPVPLAVGTASAAALQLAFPAGVPTVQAQVPGATVTVASPAAVAVNQWVHVAVSVAAGAPVTLYVNGFRVASSGQSLDAGQTLATAGGDLPTHLQLGRGLGAVANEAFSGLLNDVRLYTRALGATDVAGLAGRAHVLVGPQSLPQLHTYAPLAGTAADRVGGLLPTVTGSLVWAPASSSRLGRGALDLSGHAINAPATMYATYAVGVGAGQSWSLAAWLRPTVTLGGWQIPLSVGTAAQSLFQLVVHQTTGQLYVDGFVSPTNYRPAAQGTAATQLQPLEWAHVVLTARASTGILTLYVNGVEAGAGALPSLPALDVLRVGGQLAEAAGEPRAYSGYIEDVRLYTRALSPAEVTTLVATATPGVLEAGLQFRTPLENSAGDVVGSAPATTTGPVGWATADPWPVIGTGALDLRTNAVGTVAATYVTYPATGASPLTVAAYVWTPVDSLETVNASLVGQVPWDGTLDATGALLSAPVASGSAAVVETPRVQGTGALDLTANAAGGATTHWVTYALGSLTYPFTVACWIRPTGYSGAYMVPVSLGTSAGPAFQIIMSNAGRIWLETAVNASGYSSSTSAGAVPLNQWTHVAVTLTAGDAGRIYVNGQLLSSVTLPSGGLLGVGSAAPTQLRVGNKMFTTTDQAFKGYLDDLRLYSKALSASDINSLYASYTEGTAAQTCWVLGNATAETPGAALQLELSATRVITASATVGGTLHTAPATELGALPAGRWHHVAVVLDAAQPLQVFVNGALAGQGTGNLGTGSLQVPSGAAVAHLRLGAPIPATALTAFRGLLDDVRVYARALAGPEVAALAGMWPAPRAQLPVVRAPDTSAIWAGPGAARVLAPALRFDTSEQQYANLGPQLWDVPRTGFTWAVVASVPSRGADVGATLLWADTGSSANPAFVELSAGADQALVFRYKVGTTAGTEDINQRTVSVSAGWVAGRVQLVTCVVTAAGTLQVFVDGSSVGTAVAGFPVQALVAARLLVGRHGIERSRPTWSGNVYLAETWATALTATQVAAHAEAVKAALTTTGRPTYDALSTFQESTSVVIRNRTHTATMDVIPLGPTLPTVRLVWTGVAWQPV